MNHTNPPHHWHILGAGAIGSLWASYAYRNGQAVTLLLPNLEQLHAYQEAGGINATLDQGTQSLLPLPVLATEQLRAAAPITFLLVCTKAQQTLSALHGVREYLADGAIIVLLQNGLGIAEQIQAECPGSTVLQASTTEGAFRRKRFDLVHAGRGATQLGQPSLSSTDTPQARLPSEALATLAASLSFPPLDVTVSDNIDAVLWRKLAINCAINPLTVKYRCRNGELLDKPDALADMAELVAEIEQLSATLGRQAWIYPLLEQVQKVARDTAQNRSSMLQDIEAGRVTEIDYITGYLCRLAAEHGLGLPHNQALLEAVRRQHPQ